MQLPVTLQNSITAHRRSEEWNGQDIPNKGHHLLPYKKWPPDTQSYIYWVIKFRLEVCLIDLKRSTSASLSSVQQYIACVCKWYYEVTNFTVLRIKANHFIPAGQTDARIRLLSNLVPMIILAGQTDAQIRLLSSSCIYAWLKKK